ncbi:hypothetical protein J8281_12615 [Aquimarina sp. U1-2]|uniref:hypothetical protein n=1 Tax=Aquimarina sp. U1-2 TaxID=2823141 RepID=UPI001AEC8262|nr:hypothetical protein [Aquimarina sp. U1-2]MBP2833032.1 hypothetical protein [Aquimarina sp. U1-2]
MNTKNATTTSYIKSEQFTAKSKGYFLFGMALNFYKFNKKQKCADKSIGLGMFGVVCHIKDSQNEI